MAIVDTRTVAAQIACVVASHLSAEVRNFPTIRDGFVYRSAPSTRLEDLTNNIFGSVREIDEQITRISRSQTQHEFFIEAFVQKADHSDRETSIQRIREVLEACRNYYFVGDRGQFSVDDGHTRSPQRFMRIDRTSIMEDPLFNTHNVIRGSIVFVFRGFKEC